MDHVELLRVHTSGTDLVLRTPSGEEYLLAMDEALKRSVKLPAPRPVASVPAPEGQPLTPREIQARIRAGETAQQVAEESHTDLDHVLRYEGPVLAERDYMATRAQAVEVSSPLGHEGYRAAFGDEPASLGDMVATRLRVFGVDLSTLTWDAWKLDSGTWRIVARFDLPDGASELGEEPPAMWTFHPGRAHLLNANRWGQVLSEWEPWDVMPAQRKLVPVAPTDPDQQVQEDPVQDQDNTQEEATSSASVLSAVSAQEPDHSRDDLLDVLERRRGTRSGEEPEEDEALARLLDRSRHTADAHDAPENDEESGANEEPEVESDGEQWPPLRRVPDPIPATSDAQEHHSGPKKRRSQVPSWDEIVFGRSARNDDDED